MCKCMEAKSVTGTPDRTLSTPLTGARSLSSVRGGCSRPREKHAEKCRTPKMLDLTVRREKQSQRVIMTIVISDIGSDPHL